MSQFSEYVTGQAFALTLSRRMCEAMEYLMAESYKPEKGFRVLGMIPAISTLNALVERGLVHHYGPRDQIMLTPAGLAMYEVLIHAGLARDHQALAAA